MSRYPGLDPGQPCPVTWRAVTAIHFPARRPGTRIPMAMRTSREDISEHF